ncbi:protein kinase [Altererythrobacter aurantiacus]|uniref:non-specific serine/threonine protein kinase n=1 Tax=Parapontixanthobacter aurantiacus TaxID=1463599 RepID=A0A844ZEM3_9SPHN|nr:protein kinase [Parapontixanthobacter aurantiacus]
MKELGRYRIEDKLGEGAMADVYRAQDPEIGRTVAIKVLKREFASDTHINARFLQEARAAGALSHSNIATIYDVGEANGIAYIAMELIEGQPLDRWIAVHGRMPYEKTLRLALQLAQALAYAHAMGIVHRDVKPANILLSHNGNTLKLLDFGVARIAEADPCALEKTQVGQLIGTPRYMSPEQALGLTVDARSDLFSLGAVIYEMMTGRPAFPGSELAALAIQISQGKVAPIGEVAADCPKGLRSIIDRLLAKKPENRFADGAALVTALERELDDEREAGSTPLKLSLRFRFSIALALFTAIVLAASVSVILQRQQQTLETIAAVSGNSIARFVTGNAAVEIVENAGLPPEQQDWTALQAFVTSAAHDEDIQGIVIADAEGIVRASNNPQLIDQRYQPPSAETTVMEQNNRRVTNALDADSGGLRFVHPVDYAGVRFGTLDLVLKRDALDAALAASKTLLATLSTAIMAVVLLIGYFSGAMVARPLRRLCKALDELASGDLTTRISHRRRDEVGDAFDALNRAAASLDQSAVTPSTTSETSVLATRIAA